MVKGVFGDWHRLRPLYIEDRDGFELNTDPSWLSKKIHVPLT